MSGVSGVIHAVLTRDLHEAIARFRAQAPAEDRLALPDGAVRTELSWCGRPAVRWDMPAGGMVEWYAENEGRYTWRLVLSENGDVMAESSLEWCSYGGLAYEPLQSLRPAPVKLGSLGGDEAPTPLLPSVVLEGVHTVGDDPYACVQVTWGTRTEARRLRERLRRELGVDSELVLSSDLDALGVAL